MSDTPSELERKIRATIETVDLSNALTQPLKNSIRELLKLSAAALHSEEASVIVRDGDELRFMVVIGKVADRLTGLKIPAEKGIAGFVFSSGQPMAVTDAAQEASFYKAIDEQTGYTTQTLLATPLRFGGEVIGVLEYVNRIGEPPYAAFTSEEMDKAALYAEAIGSLVDAYESTSLTEIIGSQMIAAAVTPEQKADLAEVREWVRQLRTSAEHQDMIEMAVMLRDIAGRGPAERELCREILEAFIRHSEAKSTTEFLAY
jgi:transcriptional regulator with GAF, ATPase, and Fis domain